VVSPFWFLDGSLSNNNPTLKSYPTSLNKETGDRSLVGYSRRFRYCWPVSHPIGRTLGPHRMPPESSIPASMVNPSSVMIMPESGGLDRFRTVRPPIPDTRALVMPPSVTGRPMKCTTGSRPQNHRSRLRRVSTLNGLQNCLDGGGRVESSCFR
jgi:hypothetical protein